MLCVIRGNRPQFLRQPRSRLTDVHGGGGPFGADVFGGDGLALHSPRPPAAQPAPPDAGRVEDAVAKERIIRSLIRRSPHETVSQQAVQVLSAYPLRALEIVQAYGTRIELYDFAAGEAVPEYMETLADPRTLGCYNALANVLGMDRNHATTVPLTHEFAHALDAALGEVHREPVWKGAHTLATATDRTVRDYAKANSCEYLAEVTTAYLIADQDLEPIVAHGLAHGAYGMEERDFIHMHQNLCHGRLRSLDPDGYALADNLIQQRIYSDEPCPTVPALDEPAYHAAVEAEKAKRASS